MPSLKGHLLVASPYLSDSNFFRSVVLIVSHDESHAFGLLLNRPGHTCLDTVWEDLNGEICENKSTIRSGGPLDGPLIIVHAFAELADAEVATGVYISTQQDALEDLVAIRDEPLIPIMGYSGWGPGQLENEMEIGGWMPVPASKEIIFADAEQQWHVATKQISDGILEASTSRHAPKDPSWN